MGGALLWVCFAVGSMLCCGYASLWVVFFAMGNAGIVCFAVSLWVVVGNVALLGAKE